MSHAPDFVTPILTSMLDAAYTALDPKPSRSIIAPGLPAFDDCCNGQVWVRLVNLVPGSGIASMVYRAERQSPCGVINWQATIGVGIVRCAYTVDDRGTAPTPVQVTSDAINTQMDLADLSRAIQCDMTEIANVDKLTMLRWEPIGPEGGCVGGEWTLTILVPNCQCST